MKCLLHQALLPYHSLLLLLEFSQNVQNIQNIHIHTVSPIMDKGFKPQRRAQAVHGGSTIANEV